MVLALALGQGVDRPGRGVYVSIEGSCLYSQDGREAGACLLCVRACLEEGRDDDDRAADELVDRHRAVQKAHLECIIVCVSCQEFGPGCGHGNKGGGGNSMDGMACNCNGPWPARCRQGRRPRARGPGGRAVLVMMRLCCLFGGRLVDQRVGGGGSWTQEGASEWTHDDPSKDTRDTGSRDDEPSS